MAGMQGIVTVLNTPFREDGTIDLAALGRHARIAVEAGVAGFLVPAFAAEVLTLTSEERSDMVRVVLDVARPAGVPVVGGATAPTHADRCRYAETLGQLGCDAVLLSQPFTTRDEFQGVLRDIATASDLPVMLQDFDATGTGIPVDELIAAIEAVPAIRYVKIETTDSNRKFTTLKQVTQGRLHVSGGWAVMQLIEALDRGVDAFMPTAMNPVYVAIHRLHRAGRRDEAAALFYRLLPVLAFSNQSLEQSIHFFKRLLWRQGVYPTANLRVATTPLDSYQLRIADEMIDRVIALEAELDGTTPAPSSAARSA
jgi:4-hydroxy-tetrahydrodipicolinate synthase